MAKRTLIYILLIIAIIIAISCPFIFRDKTESINQTINLSASILSSFAAIITLYIALLLFNKYGVEAPLFEKCSAKVFSLLEQIKETTFSIGGNKVGFWVTMSDPFKYNVMIENYYSTKLIFSETYIASLSKVFDISNSPFMPPQISQKVDRLKFFMMSYDIDEQNLNNYEKVLVVGSQKIDNPKFGRFNGKDMTVFEFLSILDDIKNEVQQWVQSKSTLPVKLNL